MYFLCLRLLRDASYVHRLCFDFQTQKWRPFKKKKRNVIIFGYIVATFPVHHFKIKDGLFVALSIFFLADLLRPRNIPF